MNRLILIDGNNWGFSGNGKAPIYAGTRKVQAINYVLTRVREVYEMYPKATIIVLWDGRSWRKDYFTEYKANREKTEKQRQVKADYLDQKPDIIEGLELLGVTQAIYGNMEADDLAYFLTTKAVANGTPVTLLTADEDWMQLVQPNVNWFDVIRNKSCRYETFKNDTASKDTVGFKNTVEFIEAKCILGDVGDNVKGIHGVGPKMLETVYKIFPSFKDMLTTCGNIENAWELATHKKLPKVLRELDDAVALETLKRNHILMDLGTTYRPEPIDKKITKKPIDENAFLTFALRNMIATSCSQASAFMVPFKQN